MRQSLDLPVDMLSASHQRVAFENHKACVRDIRQYSSIYTVHQPPGNRRITGVCGLATK